MSELKPLKVLLPWMQEKIDKGLGTYAQDGNGYYFLDFETLKFYSPFDDELMFEYERELEYTESSCANGDIRCKTSVIPVVLEDFWIEAYKSYLAEKELLCTN